MTRNSPYIIILLIILASSELLVTGQQPSVYKVNRLSFNTKAFNEMSPLMLDNAIIFCSDRRLSGIKDRTTFDGRRLFNFYRVERKDSSEWMKVIELKSERSSLFNSGPSSLDPDGRTLYFTSEIETGDAVKNKNFRNRNGIFMAYITGTTISSIHPFRYNNEKYDVGQPSVSSDGQFLFFASDMPGGFGGSDLYYCRNVNDDWSEPVNLGPKINSAATENYPFSHSSGKLFFSSNRPGGFGGMDIYSSTFINGEWQEPVLLKEPVNSKNDDFSIFADSNLQKGFFTSNREGSDDIWEFESTIIRMASCDTITENSYCYRFIEENAVKFDTLPMPYRFEWKFGDGNTASGATVEHCYKGPGTYIVQLDVVNLITKEITYNEKTDTLEVSEIIQPYISSPDTAVAGKEILLNADKTNLPGWKIARFYWNFGDESVATGNDVSKVYTIPGIYNIQLIVTSEEEQGVKPKEACISKNIFILNKP
jgi:hypothetical protein